MYIYVTMRIHVCMYAFIGNAHIYEEHKEGLLKQIQLEPFEFPKINIDNKYDNIDKYNLGDFDRFSD